MKSLLDRLTKALEENQPVQLEGGLASVEEPLVRVMLDFPETPESFKLEFSKPKLYEKVLLVSGGMDSTIMWKLAQLETEAANIKCLYGDFSQQYISQELASLEKFKIPHEVLLMRLAPDPAWGHIIPARNYALLSRAADFCEHEGEIWLGAVDGETEEDKGDKSELFFRLFEEHTWRTRRKKVFVKTLKEKTKNDWLKWYIENYGVNIIFTVTCFEGGGSKHCGTCQACVRKWIALEYCKIDRAIITAMYDVHPYAGGSKHIEKYKRVLQEALDNNDFSHYSIERCRQDLKVIRDYEAYRKTL